ncbi:MAG: phospholipid/cholesterol/gamma-HCH transport system substrate-binding protein, partial [Nocardioidaceae bacterium]|nr:phospholipid/cholesterol/gamma-HCH transport system substrate-binding protein [Nocardioidaceae bacterium]
NGSLRDVYHLDASFASAGQGLITQSDVKVHGVNIGRVNGVKLREGRALVRLEIDSDEKIPVDAKATIRPKTLFGEKFVDIAPGDQEASGPYLSGGDEIEHTLGGFELEKVLTDAYPLLQALDPAELVVVVDELAKSGQGLGESINRSIVNGQKLTDINVRHDADTRQFLSDLANLSDELAGRADDLVAGARDLNVALPTINDNADDLTTLLDQTARLSGDLADILDANRGFLRKSVTEGGKAIQVLSDDRDQLIPLVIGLHQYAQTLAEVIRLEVGDGTLMAAVKGLLGGDACGVVPCPSTAPSSAPATSPIGGLPLPGLLDPLAPVSTALSTSGSLHDLLAAVIGR